MKSKSLNSFFGILDNEIGARLEKAILKARKRRNKIHKARVSYIIKEFK